MLSGLPDLDLDGDLDLLSEDDLLLSDDLDLDLSGKQILYIPCEYFIALPVGIRVRVDTFSFL